MNTGISNASSDDGSEGWCEGEVSRLDTAIALLCFRTFTHAVTVGCHPNRVRELRLPRGLPVTAEVWQALLTHQVLTPRGSSADRTVYGVSLLGVNALEKEGLVPRWVVDRLRARLEGAQDDAPLDLATIQEEWRDAISDHDRHLEDRAISSATSKIEAEVAELEQKLAQARLRLVESRALDTTLALTHCVAPAIDRVRAVYEARRQRAIDAGAARVRQALEAECQRLSIPPELLMDRVSQPPPMSLSDAE